MPSAKIIYPVAVIAMIAFLFLIKLMYDMSVQMTRMTDQVSMMNGHMNNMVEEVRAMRTSVDQMSFAFQKGGQQMQQMNPMNIMPGMSTQKR